MPLSFIAFIINYQSINMRSSLNTGSPLHTAGKVQFHFHERGLALSDRSSLKAFIEMLFKKEKKRLAEIHYIFCSDDYLLKINQQYLKHDFYTDIITFDLSEPGQPINAEIYISVDRVRDNASRFNSTLRRELHRVIFHGALHLCGYKDKSKSEELLMRKMEEKYLDLYFKD
jgi:probable rRNA maturation factor